MFDVWTLRRAVMQESTVYQSILTEGGEKEKRSIAVNLLRMGLALSDIATAVGLSLEEVKKIQLSESL
jgi:predicted transposase YdaD